MTFIKKLKAIINQFACEQDWNIHEYAVRKRDIDYRRGKADAYGDVVYKLDKLLEEFPEESVENLDKMTLTELARVLRKLFGFKYLTLDAFVHYGDIIGPNIITLWVVEPYYDDEDKQFEFLWNQDRKTGAIFDIPVSSLSVNLDLSEYKDADGNIDYSKCIVEVENASE